MSWLVLVVLPSAIIGSCRVAGCLVIYVVDYRLVSLCVIFVLFYLTCDVRIVYVVDGGYKLGQLIDHVVDCVLKVVGVVFLSDALSSLLVCRVVSNHHVSPNLGVSWSWSWRLAAVVFGLDLLAITSSWKT